VEKESKNEYRQILKATSVFGGVQVVGILVSIIRSKSIALLLGPAGMGVNALLNETLNLIRIITSVGLQTSAVKSISHASASQNSHEIGVVVRVYRRWTWVTGLLGFIVTVIGAPLLSKLAFGNVSYTSSFILVSIAIVFTQIGLGYSVIFQGLRQVGILAKTAIWGAVFGLFTSIPIYFWLGEKGIEPAIIVSSIVTLIISLFYSSRITIPNAGITWSQFFNIGKSMLALGFMLSLGGLISMAATYLVRIYISREAGMEEVGLFAAGFTILNSYVGLIFTALATDYFPKLSLVADNLKMRNITINSQAEIAILIVAPILCFFICFIDWAIIALYSEKFLSINRMLQWGGLGMFFKTASWAIGYLLLAKGNSKLYFSNELFANIYLLFLNILGYYLFGLTGLGISLVIGYGFYLIQNYLVVKNKYGFNFSSPFLCLFLILTGFGSCCLLVSILFPGVIAKIIGSVFALGASYYSFLELDKRINIRLLFQQIRIKNPGNKIHKE
jgi:O-antigen/teichoic acid export membrane protein